VQRHQARLEPEAGEREQKDRRAHGPAGVHAPRVEVEPTRRTEEQGEQGEEAQRPDPRGGEVQVPYLANGGLLVLGSDGEEGAKRHHLPAREEQNRVAGDDQQTHAGREQPVEEAELAAVLAVLGLRPITERVDAAERRDEKNLREKHRRQAVDAHLERTSRDGPGQGDAARGGRRERQRGGGHARGAGSR